MKDNVKTLTIRFFSLSIPFLALFSVGLHASPCTEAEVQTAQDMLEKAQKNSGLLLNSSEILHLQALLLSTKICAETSQSLCEERGKTMNELLHIRKSQYSKGLVRSETVASVLKDIIQHRRECP